MYAKLNNASYFLKGTMTGGGKSVARNRMGSKIKTHTRRSNSNIESQADLQNLEIMRDNLQKELEQKRDREVWIYCAI